MAVTCVCSEILTLLHRLFVCLFFLSDIMLEKLAKWNEEKAKKKQNADIGTGLRQATGANLTKRQPLKETRQPLQTQFTHTLKKQQLSTNKR